MKRNGLIPTVGLVMFVTFTLAVQGVQTVSLTVRDLSYADSFPWGRFTPPSPLGFRIMERMVGF